jgi:hypothetical protein
VEAALPCVRDRDNLARPMADRGANPMTRFDRWVMALSLLVAVEFTVLCLNGWTEVLDALLPTVYGPVPAVLLRHYLALYAALAASFSLALVTLAAAPALERALSRPRVWAASVTAASVIAATLCFLFGNHHLGGYDHSVLVDAAWRVAQGQHPYSDFICTLPPGFFLPAGAVFRAFGPSWDSLLVLHALVTGAVLAGSTLLLARLGLPRWLALLLGFAMPMISAVQSGHWWHNVQSQQAGVVYALAALLLMRRPDRAPRLVLYAVALASLLSMKPNLAGPLVLAGAALTLWTRSWRAVALAHVSAAALLLAALRLSGVDAVELISSYRSVAGRAWPQVGFPPESLWWWHCAFVALSLASAAACARSSWRPGARREVLLLLGALAAGVSAMATNWDTRFNDYPLVMLAVTLLAVKVEAPESRRRWRALATTLLWVCVTVGAVLGYTRHRTRHVGYNTFFEWNYQPGFVPHPFFAHMRSGPRLHRVVRSVDRLLATEPGSVFFGPRMEFLYAVFRRPSPRHLAIWWHPGTSFATRDTALVADRWRRSRFDVLIFLRDDYARMPGVVIDLIRSGYARDQSDPDLTVWRLRR